ncbi:MAG: hypothetical protein HY562_11330 [Ignavibacteriales bacterium]|nr:hypothetical protein [Ignavibacteriales bacterium]
MRLGTHFIFALFVAACTEESTSPSRVDTPATKTPPNINGRWRGSTDSLTLEFDISTEKTTGGSIQGTAYVNDIMFINRIYGSYTYPDICLLFGDSIGSCEFSGNADTSTIQGTLTYAYYRNKAITLSKYVPSVERGLIARYFLGSNPNDTTRKHVPMTLLNTPFDQGGIYCNGQYLYSAAPVLSPCHAITPALSDFRFDVFAISAKFKVSEYPNIFERPVFVGGHLSRWLGFILRSDGTVALRYNNDSTRTSTIAYSLNVWHQATVTYDSTTQAAKLYLDTTLACTAVIQIKHLNDQNVGITNFSNATAFRGWLKDLRVYSEVMDPVRFRSQVSRKSLREPIMLR